MIDTILFDFDGTLMDTTEIIVQSWQHTFRTMDGKERPREEIIATFGEVLKETMRGYWPDRDVDEIVEIYRTYQKDKFLDAIRLFPGIYELLEKLKADGYAMGIVTARTRRSTLEAMDRYRITDFFSGMITCDDTDEHKPSALPALMVLDRMGKDRESALIIGDSKFDILCGKNAGIKTVLAGWNGHTSLEEVSRDARPDAYITRPEELLEILKEN